MTTYKRRSGPRQYTGSPQSGFAVMPILKSAGSKLSCVSSSDSQNGVRKTESGPVDETRALLAKKNKVTTVTRKPPPTVRTETITVHSGTPKVERSYFPAKTNPVYYGDVNVLSIIDTDTEIMCCKYTEDQSNVAAGFTNGVIRLFDCNKGNCTHKLVDDECRSYPGTVTAIIHRPVSEAHPMTNMLLTSYVNGCIKCWKYQYDQCLYTIREKRQTLGLSYHPRFPKFVSYGDDAKLNLYDEEAQTQERSFYSSGIKNVINGHSSRIFACAFNPRSHHELVSGGWDDCVMCWDDRQPFATRYFEGIHMCGEGLDFDKPGKRILTCSWQEKDSIQIWDYGSCKLIETLKPDKENSKLYCGKFVPKANLLVCGGSEDNLLRVVDLNMKVTECFISNNPSGIRAFDFGSIRRKDYKENKTNKPSELRIIPRLVYVAGKRLQTVDFG